MSLTEASRTSSSSSSSSSLLGPACCGGGVVASLMSLSSPLSSPCSFFRRAASCKRKHFLLLKVEICKSKCYAPTCAFSLSTVCDGGWGFLGLGVSIAASAPLFALAFTRAGALPKRARDSRISDNQDKFKYATETDWHECWFSQTVIADTIGRIHDAKSEGVELRAAFFRRQLAAVHLHLTGRVTLTPKGEVTEFGILECLDSSTSD